MPKTTSPRAPKTKTDILQHFPHGMLPRPGQADVLRSLQAQWEEADVHVLRLPVAAGKTAVARTIQSWQASQGAKSMYAVPTNALLEQLQKEAPRMCVLKRRDSYRCKAYDEKAVMPDASCGSRHAAHGAHCADCPYIKAVRSAHGVPATASNYHTMLAHKLYKSTLVCDEAHTLLPMVREMEATHVWLRELPARAGAALRKVETYEQLAAWLSAEPALVAASPALRAVQEQLRLGGHRWLVSREDRLWHKSYAEALSLLPVDTSQSTKTGQLWPSAKTKKLVLMSATISEHDVGQLGLSGRRVAYYDAVSPIPAGHRPWVDLGARVGSLSAAHQRANLGRAGDEVARLTKHWVIRAESGRTGARWAKGLVHATYSLAEALGPLLVALVGAGTRVFRHTAADKIKVLDEWRAYQGHAVLVASGLEEGIDLKGPEFAWQVIAKVQFPSLAEPANRWLAEEEPDRYAWETLKKLLQAYGRICRGPEDRGVTYILDGSFRRLYNSARAQCPGWFAEAEAKYEDV